MVTQRRIRQCRTVTKVVCVHLLSQVAELIERFLSKLNLIEMLKKAVVSSCQAKFSNSCAPRPLWDILESIPPDLPGIPLEVLILDEALYLFLDEKLNAVKRNSYTLKEVYFC